MTKKEIVEKWFPICRPGNLVKRTCNYSDVAFFIVVSKVNYKEFSDGKKGIEFNGIWISRPSCLYPSDLHLIENNTKNCCSLINVREESTLELSSFDDVVKSYEEIYKRDIENLKEDIKQKKQTIRKLKNTLHNFHEKMNTRYQDALTLNVYNFKKK